MDKNPKSSYCVSGLAFSKIFIHQGEMKHDLKSYNLGTILDESNINKSKIQVNLFQKLLFLHQLTHNMTKDCSLIYQFLHENYKLRTCCVHTLFFCFCFDIQNNLCTQHVLSL